MNVYTLREGVIEFEAPMTDAAVAAAREWLQREPRRVTATISLTVPPYPVKRGQIIELVYDGSAVMRCRVSAVRKGKVYAWEVLDE